MSVLPPLGLYLVALIVRLAAASLLPFPTTEPSAYYVGVAANLVGGQGLVSDVVWSYATPPLVVPKPAFELWMPMGTFVPAVAQALLGATYWSAQLASAALGALVAPLAWAVGREAARAHGLDPRRGLAVAVASGLLASVMAPLVLAAAVPDSTTPFTVFVLASALLVPRVIARADTGGGGPVAPRTLAGLGLGGILGLAYLSRQEVIWLGLTIVLLQAWVLRRDGSARWPSEMVRRLTPVVVGGLLVVGPWLVRDWVAFGSPFPGQAMENMFFVRNEDVFAFSHRPGAATYLAQGLATVLWNPLAAAVHEFIGVLVIPAFPIGVAGLLSLVGLHRSPALRTPTSLVTLLVSGGWIFLATAVLFPVATRWGTFLHSSGPLLVGLGVMAALGADGLLAWISRRRRWAQPNTVLGPLALITVASLLAAFQVMLFAQQSRDAQARYGNLASAIEAQTLPGGVSAPIISDHPMWLAHATGRAAIALPDEDLGSLLRLASTFDTRVIVVVDERGHYPDALLDPAAKDCLRSPPLALEDQGPAWLFVLDDACVVP